MQEGTGYAVPTAYVEVVFDNSDGRFPVCAPETVGVWKNCLRVIHDNQQDMMPGLPASLQLCGLH
eukprot:366510-Chlamydomonas_euryale.AAC.28